MNAVMHDLARAHAVASAPAFDRTEAIRLARDLLSVKEGRTALAYPIAALGPLAPVCEAVANSAQVQPAMAGQCLLGAASLLTQGLFNVDTLAGPRPLSVFLLTLGDSGDGKSTAEKVAMMAVHKWQRAAARTHAEAQREFEASKARRKKSEDVPEAPASPFRVVNDPTVEGLRRDLDTGPCSQGVFTDEAASILAGYGMSAEHRAKTAGVYSKLYDDGHLSVSRAGAGRVERYGKRLAVHWLIQPMPAAESIGDPMLAHLGFWPRFLAAWPQSQEPRVHRDFSPELQPAVRDFWRRSADLLALPLPDDAGDCPRINLDADARVLLGKAFERFEHEGRRGGLRVIKPFALRATEQVCRVAGVLAAFEGSQQVTLATVRGALALVGYSLETWRSLIDDGAADRGSAQALRLYEWLTGRPGWRELLSVIVNAGPTCARTKEKRDAAIALLHEVGLIEVVAGAAIALMPDCQRVQT